jgi:hypothetical protein
VPETVISRGKVVIENEKYVGKAGDGKYLKRSTVQLRHREVAAAVH